ncbi:MAG: hypothetical protein WBM35_13800, partial [Candidatus Electrothrix sp.]
MKKTKNGLYIGDTWETFLAQRDRLPNWKIPLSIATVLHLVVFTSAAVFPDIGKKFKPDNVITIDLLSLPSDGPAAVAPLAGEQVGPRSKQQVSAPQQPKTVATVEKVVPEKVGETIEPPAPAPEVTEIAEQVPLLPVVAPRKNLKVAPKIIPKPVSPPEPVAQVAQVKTVSLHPLKRKKKLAEDIRLAEVKEQEKREKKQAQQKLQQEQEWLATLEKKRLVEEQKREKAAEQERKLVIQKKKQLAAEKKKKQAEQQRRKKEISEAARLARQAEKAAEQAQLEAARARNEYASVAQAVSDLNTPLVSNNSSNSGFSSGGYSERDGGSSGRESGGSRDYGSERGNSAVLNQYSASLNGWISSHWQLPEVVDAKSNLRTTVALIVRRDGSLKD